MEKVAEKREREMRPGFVLSVLLHVLFVAIFLLPLLPAPPQAKPEQSVNVELVPQKEEKQELATKENEKPDQPPKPTQKPDEKPAQQTAEAKDEPQQPEGKKSDQQPPKQSDPQGKEPADKPPAKPDETKTDKPVEKAEEKPAPKPDDPGAAKPVEKAEDKPSATETPFPDMKGEDKDANTTQQADAVEQANDNAAEQQAAEAQAQAAAQAAAQAQAAQEAQQAQQQADAKDQQTNAAQPPASDATNKASSTAPDVLATNEPSDSQIEQPQAPSTDPNDPEGQQAAQAPSVDPPQQSPKGEDKIEAQVAPKIAVPSVKPSPSQQNAESQSPSGNQGNPAEGTALVTEPQPPKSVAPKRAIQAKKLYSSAEMARLSKSEYDAWKKLPRRQRVAYLCNSEEKLQYRNDLRAVGYVNSALSQAMVSDATLFGDGVAVQTPSGWQRVAFTCEVDGDALKVNAFSYTNRGHLSPSQVDKLGFLGN
ncbi:DUF930 domain-containing protein [Rhizobium sp. P38BS-XIX]|uniref:DUF930 domain-containing protein n=1 Tax=Rhizobium sp. P38BS-XIX TaxID=2726740 RepID=UPI00145774FB|nr:DUF930 domain-containing protein [Rhizobium sp. P38BS-XIX]NLR96661.1 DUF930 domain-containing protein [Rhizobium sp. P38BS-XIX]